MSNYLPVIDLKLPYDPYIHKVGDRVYYIQDRRFVGTVVSIDHSRLFPIIVEWDKDSYWLEQGGSATDSKQAQKAKDLRLL